jgi:hypothetical protein
LLELGAESLFGLWRRKHLLELLDGFSDLLFIACIVSQSYAEETTHVF